MTTNDERGGAAPRADYSRRILVMLGWLGVGASVSLAIVGVGTGLRTFAYANGACALAFVGFLAVVTWGRTRANLKPVALGLAMVQCLVASFTATPGAVELPPLLASLAAWLLMYHDRVWLRVIGVLHIGGAVAVMAFAPAIAPANSWIAYVALVFVALIFAGASLMSIASNRRYWERMRRLEGELGRHESSLRETAERLGAQHAELETAAARLRATVADNAPQTEALRLAYEEQAQIAQAASSDLRQPLRNINSFVQLIRRRLVRLGVVEEVGDYLDFVTDGAARMNGMVDDLLRYSESREEREPDAVDTGAVLAGIRDNLRDLLEREGATLRFPADLPTVLGYETQVLQLFQNLISNGVKFKRPGVAPRCEVGCVVEDGVACFSVSDNGIGIPANRLGDVFGLFTRLHERGAYEGTGIGLATCRRIVMAAGGEIWAESEEGAGTTFRFTWPLGEGASPVVAGAEMEVGA